jgi:tRNA(Ile)-lysidine synthase
MPILATYNPNVIDNIARSVQLLSEAQETINAQAMQDMQQTEHTDLQFSSAQRVLNIDALQKLPMYRQRQLLHYWLGQDEPLPPAKQLVDDVLTLSQRDDQDHQTELFWQGRKASYTIRRYRQQLYRMSSEWLSWLKLPLSEQVLPLSSLSLSKNNSADNSFELVTLCSSNDYIWQLRVMGDALLRLLENSTDGVAQQATLKIAPLDRKQRLKTEMAARPQAGKKLYQTIGIPLWLRKSLMVVSINFIKKSEDGSDIQTNIPLLLASPFESWLLSSEQTDKDTDSDAKSKQFAEYIRSELSLK